MLFTGTVRSNLDPFTEYSDQQLWDAIQQVGSPHAFIQPNQRDLWTISQLVYG